MNTLKRRMILVLPIWLWSCQGVFERVRNTLWIDKQHHYSISENLIDSSRTLFLITRERNFERLDYVSKIGDNNNYIIAQTKDTSSIIGYWIIDKAKDSSQLTAKQVIQGPYNSDEFLKEKERLGISNLTFQKEFE